MKKYFDVLRKCPLFNGIEDDNLMSIMGCIGAKYYEFSKKDVIAREKSSINSIGIVLSGVVQIEKTDFDGNRSVLNVVEPSELFGESFAYSYTEEIPFDVVAKENAVVMFVDCRKIVCTCSNACEFHNKLIMNMLKIMATKNIQLTQRAEITSRRTTREKLMAFLYMYAQKTGKNIFVVPYDRQALADYLEVDRSGLSNEISKMKKAGIIDCEKSTFKLLNK